MNILKKLLIMITAIYIIIATLLYINQRSILYIPSSPLEPQLKDAYFNNNDIKIKTFIANPNKDDAIIYFGGNAENVAFSVSKLADTLKNHTLYFVNYRGYGGSSGEPTEKGIYSDALFIYDQIKKEHKNINLIGRSLGTGVATYLASKRPIHRLVLVTPFDSILSVAQEKFSIFPMSILLKDRYDSIGRVSKITAEKTLIIRGGQDKIITPIHTQRLSDAFKPLDIENLYCHEQGHNNIEGNERYYSRIKQFFQNKSIELACSYYGKPKGDILYGENESFKDCGTLIGDKLTLKKKHLDNIGFLKGEEAQYQLNTIYSSAGFFYITKTGKTLKMYIFDNGADYFSEGLARYISNNKLGFTDTKLNIIIPAQYDYALPFNNGFAIVSNGSHQTRDFPEDEHTSIVGGVWGAIDKNGTVVVPLKYKYQSEVEKNLTSLLP